MDPSHNDTSSASAGSVENERQHESNRQQRRPPVGELILLGIFMMLLLYFLKYAAAILVPFTLMVLLSLLLTPIVDFFLRLRIPKPVGSAIVVAGIVAVMIGGLALLSVPAEDWLDKSPQIFAKIERQLEKIKRPLKKVQEAAEQMDGLTEVEDSSSAVVVAPETQKVFKAIFSATPEVIASVVLSMVLLYFLLYKGKAVIENLVNVIFWLAGKRSSRNMGDLIQQEISRYLLVITSINICLGIIVATIMTLIGLPNPILWGTLAALLNYAPYIGAILTAIIIAIVSFATFDNLAQSLLAPTIFLMLTGLEGQIITPQILGGRFSMNPLLVFLAIIFWGWLWGYWGALLAIPLLVSGKIICNEVEALRPIAEFLEKT